ncbi:hypothetical protein H9L10_09590 [Phycicoccus endophyticus]|uniref:Uncharacterized protein n=1 Tax=Phycicoccus endophyticus TaxID=1690220 RepID=A0A7G9QYZ7_9MICO|nr:hypothetical protein [Phycicoccus endophyticus]QNN48572.1 hypothetical protein H9L10_09590 [Phycicoccus endophyticus]
MTWSLLAAGGAVLAVLAAAWWLGRQRLGEASATAPGPTFGLAVRGYRMDQVDEVVDLLERQVAEREREARALRGEEAAGTSAGEVSGRRGDADPGDEPPPRRRPVAGPGPATGRPARLRPADLLAPLLYLGVAGYVTMHLLAAVRTGYLSQGVQDQQAFEWYFGATAHNLATLANPLASDLQNYPTGVNLMANASVLGLGVPLAPLTLLAGPQVTFVLVELAGLTLTASAWYWLLRRRLPVHPAAAFLGGLLAGFGPGMVSHANGHPNFVVQALVPVVIDRLLRLAEGRRPVRDGVVLGLLAAWQVLIGEEVLLLAGVGVLVAGAVLAVHRGVRWRQLLVGLGVGAGVALTLVGVPLWWQFFGPQSYTSIWHPRRATTSPPSGAGPPAPWVPTPGPRRRCR